MLEKLPTVFLFIFFLSQEASAGLITKKRELAQVTCVKDAGRVAYTVYQMQFDLESEFGDERRLVVFRLERLAMGAIGDGEVVWQNETMYLPDTFPWPFWQSDLVCDTASGGVHVILAYNRGITDMALDLYFVPESAAATLTEPPSLTAKTPQTPKLQVESLVRYVGDLPFRGGGLKSVEATRVDDHLKVVMVFRSKRAMPIHFEIDLETKEIRRVPEDPRAKGETPP